jgi:hypothetical protein
MEILILGLLALVMILTFFVIALKLVWLGGKLLLGLLLLPLKLLGALAGGAAELVVLPFKLLFFFILMFVMVVVGIVLLPILLPILIAGGFFVALIASVF